jgi:hypothetical protein
VPGFLHCPPDWRDIAAQRGIAAKTSRAFLIDFMHQVHGVIAKSLISVLGHVNEFGINDG